MDKSMMPRHIWTPDKCLRRIRVSETSHTRKSLEVERSVEKATIREQAWWVLKGVARRGIKVTPQNPWKRVIVLKKVTNP